MKEELKNKVSDKTIKIKTIAAKKINDAEIKYSIKTYILFFFIFSFIGWVWEVILELVLNGVLVNRGTLIGPWLPIYGSGGVIILIFLKKLYKKPILIFFINMILCSTIEYFTSWYLEMKDGMRWWDYSNYFLNLNGRICLEGAIIFGIGGCAIIYLIAPKLKKLVNKIPNIIQTILCIILVLLISMDFYYSSNHPHVINGVTTVQK